MSMSWFNHRLARALGASLLVAAAGCDDVLSVENPNNPETARVLATPADVEALIRGSYIQVLDPLLQSDGINMQLANVAFENSSWPANFGMHERSKFPRDPIINAVSNQFHPDYYEVWSESYAAIRSASDGLKKLSEPGFTLGSAAQDARARAFGKFVQFLGHAHLALTYDKASIYDETIPVTEVRPLARYDTVMTAALGYADAAIAIATANPTISFPADWMGEAVSQARFIQIVNSFKARYRTQVARNPTERAAVNWNAVLTETAAGITTDYAPVDDDDKWDYWMQDYMSFRGAWHQVGYVVHGMADTSGAYQTWMAPFLANNPTQINTLTAFVIQTPDRRFPRGTDLTAQRAAPGRNIRAKTNNTGEGGWGQAPRGTWRWSHYIDIRYQNYYNANNTGQPIPIIQAKEVQLIRAEALFRTGDIPGALTIVNNYRVTDGGLPPATAAGTGVAPNCVPRLPNGSCGSFFEALKWEKRMIMFMTVYGGFYFDSRGWGDLPRNTYLHYPVPARELEVRQLPLYTFGGGGEGSAPVGTYGY
jgi:hypothetical protein